MNEQEQFEQEQQQEIQPGQIEQNMQPEQIGQDIQPEQDAQVQKPDNGIYTTPDVYQSQEAQEIYRTPDMSTEPHNTGGLFSGSQPVNDTYIDPYNNNGYETGQAENNIYNGPYTDDQYGTGQSADNTYGKQPYGSQQPGNNTYGDNRYGNNQYGNNQYGNNQYGNPYGNPYNPDSYGYNPYSPYAVPTKKKNTGLIVGVIIGVAFLFLIAVLALFYHAIDDLMTRREEPAYTEQTQEPSSEEHQYNNDIDKPYRSEEEDDYFYHEDDPYDRDDYDRDDHYDDYDWDDYDDYDDHDYDDDEYYTLHDDIKDLSYAIDWEIFDYDADGENVIITVEYPRIKGGDIPNREMINDVLEEEKDFFVGYYEDEYSRYMNDNDSYFYASSTAYVTYMSEDILSVAFSEAVYSDYFDSISLYCVNIDLQNGVILDNTDILSVDDDFSIDFRYRSEEQNGSVEGLDRLSDQEITEMLKSTGNLIVFYTPQGLEVGLNYDQGYVTVTYHDYKEYLKTF
ncbi:MAG: hypothetical protein NC314_12065 [Roseburia sp.]|nr:hypothetical protein [Roseburia sp.]MCM1243568.1 hypothetical protein [Roseburia sp.]